VTERPPAATSSDGVRSGEETHFEIARIGASACAGQRPNIGLDADDHKTLVRVVG
jgi:hypothetical protein